MAKYLITGVSSGLGKALTKQLVKTHSVWGTARTEKSLKEFKRELNTSNFNYSTSDQAETADWQNLIKNLTRKAFTPEVIIFNAAISINDLERDIDFENLKKMMEINFMGIMKGIQLLLPIVKPNTQFIAISSFSAFKGSGQEGVGYATSKAALSVAFESLFQKYKDKKILFKTIYFGPIQSGMAPFKKNTPFMISEEKAVNFILKSTKDKKGQYYYPSSIFFIMKIIKLLPSDLYFKILSLMESARSKYVN